MSQTIEFGIKFTVIDEEFYARCAEFANTHNGVIRELTEVEIIDNVEYKLYQLVETIVSFDELKAEKIDVLWGAFKAYQRKYVDPEDLTLAASLMIEKQPKGTSVAMWVQTLWAAYYTTKYKINNCTTKEEVVAISTDPVDYMGAPEYTIMELNIEYNEFLKTREVI